MSGKLKICGEIRDPIHGLIPVTDIEFKVMDTSSFQRLRRIKQLALADLGFHGAMHNRFGHSVGVMHIASKMIEHLENAGEVKLKGTEMQDIRLAGLLHDIGHGPFSHISEYLLKYMSPQSEKKGNIEEIHEAISHRIIAEDRTIKDVLGEARTMRIISILSTDQPSPDFKHDLVSGPLDADKMDYLLRDSYFTGVKYGVFDLDRLINVLTMTDENRMKRLAAKREGVQAVEQYVLAKYFIAHQVYQHRIRHITDKMIIEGVSASITDGNEDLKKVYSYSKKKAYVTEYLKWDDELVCQSVLSNSKRGSKGYKYFSMLRDRQLLKEISNIRVNELDGGESLQAIEKIEEIRKSNYDDLVSTIEQEFSLLPGFTHVLAYSLKVPLIQKSFGIVDEQSIRIKCSEKTTTLLENESPLYGGIVDDAKNHFIQIIGIPKIKLKSRESREKLSKKILTKYFEGNL
ncbi:MAG: HD domain-containing protein [candidate division Zixibacteria bacterium]